MRGWCAEGLRWLNVPGIHKVIGKRNRKQQYI